MQLGELGDWMSPSVVQGQPQSSGRGFRGSSSQKMKRLILSLAIVLQDYKSERMR